MSYTRFLPLRIIVLGALNDEKIAAYVISATVLAVYVVVDILLVLVIVWCYRSRRSRSVSQLPLLNAQISICGV